MESRSTKPGHDVVVQETGLTGVYGVSTCYDMRFPELYTCLVQHGAQLLLVPSAFTVPTGRAHWETLLRARAIENQCYVLAAAQVGLEVRTSVAMRSFCVVVGAMALLHQRRR
jgi:deaminated glutathione amidase